VEFQLKLDGVDQSWQTQAVYHLGAITPGVAHTWQVRSRNASGNSSWSAASSFTIQSPTAAPDAADATAPFIDNMENGYNGWSMGKWDQTLDDNATPGGDTSWHYEINDNQPHYNTGAPNSGYLTSPSIYIDSPGYALQFWYLYETEGPGNDWDQRWVQLSVGGGHFFNVLQLFDDPPNFWQQSPPIDLSPYAGQNIQVRFHFETLDAYQNNFRGWFIDDFTVDKLSLLTCTSDSEPDNSPGTALNLSYGSTVVRKLCPQGDVDHYRFTAVAGDKIGVSAIAENAPMPDAYLFLLDSDFTSVLAENDDRYSGYQTDSFLSYRLSRSGTYYIKMRAWNHPSAGGNDYIYTLSLIGRDTRAPSAQFIAPITNARVPYGGVAVSIQASDTPAQGEVASGVSHVDFLWHSGDWANSDWTFLGSDWDGSNGWSYNIDTASLPGPSGAAIFVRVYDWAGNWRGAAAWNLHLDLPFDMYMPVVKR
jgi:hypothetical protein